MEIKPFLFLMTAWTFLFFTGCQSQHSDPVISWEHAADDPYLDLVSSKEAFVETNQPGEIGGVLVISLTGEQQFRLGADEALVIENYSEGVFPEVSLHDSLREIRIAFSGKALNHRPADDVMNMTVYLPEHFILSGGGPLSIDNLNILFHDIPSVWKSSVTGKEYGLVFNDEFESDEIDTNRWGFRSEGDKKTRTIQYQGEPVDIMVENEASVLEDGHLSLKVYKKEDEAGKVFTGGILTHGKFMPRYGYFETLASFAECSGFGHWPAFWLHFDQKDKNTTGTEIDIFEYIAADKTIFQTLHWYIDDEHFRSSEHFVLENPVAWHRFGLEWTPGELIFYVDGEMTRHLKNAENDKFVPDAYQMVYYSMSAGTWGGNVADPSNDLPATSKFEYCRVYQAPGQDALYYQGGKPVLIGPEARQGRY